MGIFNKNKGFQSIISAGGKPEYSMFADAISNRNYSLELVYNKVEETITLVEIKKYTDEIDKIKSNVKKIEIISKSLETLNGADLAKTKGDILNTYGGIYTLSDNGNFDGEIDITTLTDGAMGTGSKNKALSIDGEREVVINELNS